MNARVLSINVGHSVPQPYTSAPGTAIDKKPVHAVQVRDPGPKHGGLGSGIVGDDIGNRRHHGGRAQAVYAYAREDLDWWSGELQRDLPDGTFGENLTVTGIDCTNTLVGTRWRVGSAVLEACGPRIPCRTFAGHLDEQRWVKRFTEVGATGVYLAVAEPGTITTGDTVTIDTPDHDITILMLFRALMGDRELAARIGAANVLSPESTDELRRYLR